MLMSGSVKHKVKMRRDSRSVRRRRSKCNGKTPPPTINQQTRRIALLRIVGNHRAALIIVSRDHEPKACPWLTWPHGATLLCCHAACRSPFAWSAARERRSKQEAQNAHSHNYIIINCLLLKLLSLYQSACLSRITLFKVNPANTSFPWYDWSYI